MVFKWLVFFRLFLIGSCAGSLFLERLESLVDYGNSLLVDPNFLLGVAIAKGRMENLKPDQEIKRILGKLENLEETVEFFRNSGNKVNEFVGRNLVNSSLWRHVYPARKLQRTSIEFGSLEEYLKLANSGKSRPNGPDSDFCLSQIFNNCEISNKKCLSIMSLQKRSVGYQQTHKLLFYIILGAKCQGQRDKYFKRTGTLCSAIYEETKYVIREIDEVPEFKDLAMEQVFLCNFLGFFEFLNQRWIKLILSWQNLEKGCFGYKDNECQNHISGLGAANLANFEVNFRLK